MTCMLKLRPYHSALLVCVLMMFCGACNRNAPTPANSLSSSSPAQTASAIKHYSFKGKIVAIDTKSGNANIDGEDIPGFMGAMTMQYEIRPVSDLQKLHPGDSISANLVVDNSGDIEKYWLENVTVTPAAMPKP